MNLIIIGSPASGTVSVVKNGDVYLSRSTTGNSSGILATGDTFDAALSAGAVFGRQLIVESSTRGVLYDVSLEPDDFGSLFYTDTRQAGENIVVNASVAQSNL
jgi:hypothetical protein